MGTMIQGLPGFINTPIVATFIMDATTDFVAFRFLALSAAPIAKAEVYVLTKTGTPGNLECVLAANVAAIPQVSGGVPVDVGGGSPTLVSIPNASISNNAQLTITFTNPFTPTAGTWYWLVLYPGAGGSGWSGSHRYIFHTAAMPGLGPSYGDEIAATSTDTGTAWSRVRGISYCSFLTTGDAYLPMLASACFSAVTSVDVDDSTNPDERGTAFAVPADMTATVRGMSMFDRAENANSDFTIAVYEGDTQKAARAIDRSEFDPTSASNLTAGFLFPVAQTIAAGTTGRVTLKATAAADYCRRLEYGFTSQAQRESALLFRDWWYCHRNGGAGSFTDDKTKCVDLVPHVEFAASGGGGSGIGVLVGGGLAR